jgi:hypothetical protein
MNRIQKAGNELFKTLTLPIRVCVGIYKAVAKETPERIEFPYTLTKKEDNNERSNTRHFYSKEAND